MIAFTLNVLNFLKQVGDMIQGMAMGGIAMVDGVADEVVILGVMEVGTTSLALQGGGSGSRNNESGWGVPFSTFSPSPSFSSEI
jgi:hypothetical protein